MSLYKGDTLIAGNNNVGVGKSETVLWSGSASSAGTVMDLSDDFTNYDELVFVSFFGSGVMNKEMKANVNELYSNYLAYPTISTYHLLLSYFSSNYYGLKVITNTQFKIQNASTSGFLTKIIGVKYAKVVQANPASYTLGEQVIGTWIDGKPLYRKVVEYKTNPNNVSIPVDNYDTIYLGDATFAELINGGTYALKSYYASSNDYLRFGLRKTQNTILYVNSSNFTFVRAVYEFVYTKTTD